MSEHEEARQKRNVMARLERQEKRFASNFYAIDIETSGFEHNEPLQVGVVLFEKGKPKKQYNQYFLPVNRITASASLVNGMTCEKLRNLGA